MHRQPRRHAPVVLRKARPLLRVEDQAGRAEALRVRPEAELMHRRANRRATAIGICMHIERVVRDPVHQPAGLAACRSAVVAERPLGVRQRVRPIAQRAKVRAELHEVPSLHPGQHIHDLQPPLVRIRSLSQRRRRAKHESIRPDRHLRRHTAGPHGRLLRQRRLRRLVLQLAPKLNAHLVAQTRRHKLHPASDARIHRAIARSDARQAAVHHRARARAAGIAPPRAVVLQHRPAAAAPLPVESPEVHGLVRPPRHRPGQRVQIVQRCHGLRSRHATIRQKRRLRRRQRVETGVARR